MPPDFPAGRLATPEHVIFKAPDGTDVHAQLFTPAQRPGRRPAVVFVHGGPPRQMLLGWHYYTGWTGLTASGEIINPGD